MLYKNRAAMAVAGWHISNAGITIIDAANSDLSWVGHTLSHHIAAWSVQSNRNDGVPMAPLGEIRRVIRDEMASGQNVLMSSECFYWELRHIDWIKSLRDLVGPNIRILVWLRNRFDFVDSMYAQSVYDHGEKRSAADYIRANAPFLGFGQALSTWRDVFGPDALEVRQYTRSTDPFLALTDSLGITREAVETEALDVNSSVPRAAIPILRSSPASPSQIALIGDRLKRHADLFPKVRLLSDDDVSFARALFSPTDPFLESLGSDMQAITATDRYLSVPYAGDLKVSDIERGFGALIA